MAECKETRDLCRKLEARPLRAMTYPLIGSREAPSHWPDRFLTWKGFNGFVEFKNASRKVDEGQLQCIEQLKASGTFACVVRLLGGNRYLIDDELNCSGVPDLVQQLERARARWLDDHSR
jgi:hypothetical protein